MPKLKTAVQDGWLYIADLDHPEQYDLDKSGKWLIWASHSDPVSNWDKVRIGLEQGLLGPSAKTFCNDVGEMICVYTRDYTDTLDVVRVWVALYDLGINWRLSYKRDTDTINGVYGNGSCYHIVLPPHPDMPTLLSNQYHVLGPEWARYTEVRLGHVRNNSPHPSYNGRRISVSLEKWERTIYNFRLLLENPNSLPFPMYCETTDIIQGFNIATYDAALMQRLESCKP
jgi:Domain of unknown function (DUF1917)